MHGIALDAPERAAKPLAALMRDRHLDLHQVAGIAFEIGAAHQRPVDPRRGNLQPVGPVDRIGDSALEIASQSSICIDPSGRSAMIWTVQPNSPEILIRTSR